MWGCYSQAHDCEATGDRADRGAAGRFGVAARIRESLRVSKAIDEAKEDFRLGHFYTAEEFMAEVEKRWPLKKSKASSVLEDKP
jgi:hypothetical protein